MYYIYIFNIYKAKATAALGSFGNCSDALQRKDISKYSVGFIPDLSLMSKDALLKHLMTNGGRNFSKSSANKAIKQFQLIIEREFWSWAFESMKKYERTGVMLHILGLGVRKVFFRLCYVVGDNPALNRFCGIYEGNASKS